MRSPATKEIAAAARAEFKAQRKRLLGHIRHLDAVIEGSADMVALDVNVLRLQRDALQELADRIATQLRSREWLFFGLLQAAENEWRDLGYTAPSEGKPFGPGIEYLVTAAATHGYTLGPDRAKKLIERFNALPRISAKLGGESELRAHVVILRKGQLIDE